MTDDISAWGEAPEPDGEDTADTFDLGGTDLGGTDLGGYDAGDQMPDLEGDDGFGPADGFEPDDGTAGDGTDDGTGGDGGIAATFEEPLDDASDTVPSDAVPSDAVPSDGDLGDADGEAGLGPADDTTTTGDATTLDTTADADSIVGADPDAEPYADGTWPAPEFPAALNLVPPVPVDGFPWADPDTLGDPADPGTDPTALSADLAEDLAAYAGGLGTDWAGLAASDDPATAALARFWAPPGA